jgi:hypothetical protein
MRTILALVLAVVVAICLTLASLVSAASDEFYRGKVIRIVVGFSAGGGFDTYARSVSRTMGKYIPGNPTVVVENMTGAGSLIAANHVYKVAKPDGLTIGAFNGNQILNQLVGAPGIEFDARKTKKSVLPAQNNGWPPRHRSNWAAALLAHRRTTGRRFSRKPSVCRCVWLPAIKAPLIFGLP